MGVSHATEHKALEANWLAVPVFPPLCFWHFFVEELYDQ